MKTITLISLVFIFFIGHSQTQIENNDINTRWIYLEPNDHNSILFQTENYPDSVKYLIDFVEKMSKVGASIFFLEKNDIKDKFKYYADIFAFPNRDSILTKYPDDYFVKWKLKKPQNFIVGLKYYCSLKTADSLDVVIIENGGDETTIIAPIIYTFIEKNAISNIRIREELIYNSKTQTFEFSPVGIFLAPQLGNNSNYEIWIDFERLKSNIPNPEKHAWYNFILNKQYSGFQYMQLEKNVNRYIPEKLEEITYDYLLDPKSELQVQFKIKTLLNESISVIQPIDNNRIETTHYRDCSIEITVVQSGIIKFNKIFVKEDFQPNGDKETTKKLVTVSAGFEDYNKKSKTIKIGYVLKNPETNKFYYFDLFIKKDGSYYSELNRID